METKEQALIAFHNAIGDAIYECLCAGNVTPEDILDDRITEI